MIKVKINFFLRFNNFNLHICVVPKVKMSAQKNIPLNLCSVSVRFLIEN